MPRWARVRRRQRAPPWTPRRTARADVAVDLDRAAGQRSSSASGEGVEGYTVNGTSPGPLIEATVGPAGRGARAQRQRHRRASRCTGTGSTCPTPRTASPASPRTPIKAGQGLHLPLGRAARRHLLVPLPPGLARAGVAGGLLGAHRDPPAHAATRRRRDVVALAHLYDGDETVNGRTGDQRGRGAARPAGPGARDQHRQRPASASGPSAPYRLRRDRRVRRQRSRPRSTDRSVVIPAGGRADLEVTVPDATAARVGVQLGDGRAGRRARRVDGAEGARSRTSGSTCCTTAARAAVPFDTATPTGRSRYSIGRRPGFIDGQARALVEHQRPPLPRHADVRPCARATSCR